MPYSPVRQLARILQRQAGSFFPRAILPRKDHPLGISMGRPRKQQLASKNRFLSHLTHRQFRTDPPGNLARLLGSTGYAVIPVIPVIPDR